MRCDKCNLWISIHAEAHVGVCGCSHYDERGEGTHVLTRGDVRCSFPSIIQAVLRKINKRSTVPHYNL